MIEQFLSGLKTKSVHIVGVSGAEGSNILRFLVKHGITHITTHDYVDSVDLEKNFRIWHRGVSTVERESLLVQFKNDLQKTTFRDKTSYLQDILNADLIFVPQSWRLYKAQNKLLWAAKKSGIPFYSITRLYLDLSKAHVIAVTGTVGKGSTSHLIAHFLKQNGKKVYLAGNDTWMIQMIDKLDSLNDDAYLVLEVSHRQLLDGYTQPPKTAVITNIYPNHLDELSFDQYRKTKESLVTKQTHNDCAILNYDQERVRGLKNKTKAKVIFHSLISKKMNTENIQKIYDSIMSIKTDHYRENIITALTVIDSLGLSITQSLKSFPQPLAARMQYISSQAGRMWYDDIKSTTPWATLKAIEKIHSPVILIAGGDTKGIEYTSFFEQVKKSVKKLILLKSPLGEMAKKNLNINQYEVVNSLERALKLSLSSSIEGDTILISPAAAYFYSKYMKTKKPLRVLITSLVPEGQKSGD